MARVSRYVTVGVVMGNGAHACARGRAVVALLGAALLVAVCAACGSSLRTGSTGRFSPAHRDTLTVATAFFPAPGFWEGSPSAPTGGLEWELALRLAHRFRLAHVSVVVAPFGDLVQGRLHGADLAISELTPTDERRAVLSFTAPYLVAPPGVVVRPATATPDESALRSLQWVTVTGSTLTAVVRNQVRPERSPLPAPGRPQALEAIDSGAADAMLLDLPVAVALARSAPGSYKVGGQLPGAEGLAVALPHGSKNFDAADTAIRALVADRSLDKLSLRWLGSKLSTDADKIPLIRTEP